MKKGAFIALLALATSLGAYADGGGKKKNKKKEKAKIECCEKSKCSKDEKPNCCEAQPTCCTKKN
jgi:hypothetical protein